MANEDEVLRDFLLNSASDMTNVSNEPTEISLYDTVEVLSKRNPHWANDEFCQMILAWQASHFLNNHADKVIAEKCPHLRELCLEYRELETMNGKPLHHLFGIKALDYIMPKFEDPYLDGPFGTSPVRNAFFGSIVELKDEVALKCCGKSAFDCECSVTPPPGTVTTLKEKVDE